MESARVNFDLNRGGVEHGQSLSHHLKNIFGGLLEQPRLRVIVTDHFHRDGKVPVANEQVHRLAKAQLPVASLRAEEETQAEDQRRRQGRRWRGECGACRPDTHPAVATSHGPAADPPSNSYWTRPDSESRTGSPPSGRVSRCLAEVGESVARCAEGYACGRGKTTDGA